MRRTPQALGVVGPRTASKGQRRKFAQFFYLGEAAALLRVSGRTVIHAARVLSEDSPAAPAGRLAVEQGRITVSDASTVIDEPTEVQIRALERVTGGGSKNLAGAAQGLPPRDGLRGGRGYRRCWADPMAGLANAGTMGLTSRRGHGGRRGGGGVRSGAVAGVGSVARGCRCSGPGSTHPSGGPESHGELRRAGYTASSMLFSLWSGRHTGLKTGLEARPGGRAALGCG